MKRLLVLLAACGGTSDPASPDAPPMMPGSVSVRVTVAGAPEIDLEVVFQEADSTVKSVTTTDREGRATGDISNGGFVTVVDRSNRLSTFTGVQANDELQLDLIAQHDEGLPVTVMMQIEADPGAVTHQVKTTCGDAIGFGLTQPEQVTLLGCSDEADMLVISGDDEGGLLRSRFHRSLRLDQTVELTGAYAELLSPQVQYSNLPTGVTFVGAHRRYLTPHGAVFDVSTGATLDGVAAISTIRMPEITPLDGDVVLTSSAPYPPLESIGEQLILEWSPASGNDRDYSLNVGGAMLAGYSVAPTYATRVVSWSEGSGQAANFARASMSVYRDDIPEGRAWTWRIAGAHDGAALAFPALPVARDGFDFNVADGDSASVNVLTTARLPSGYDDPAVRANAFGDLKQHVSGTSGQLVIQELFDPE